MSKGLTNKTVLITGASSGIGLETAYAAAKAGANLILSARRVDKLAEAKIICEELGAGEVLAFPIDIADPDSVDTLIDYLENEAIQIDVLVNNAGFGHSEPFVELDFEVVTELFRVNVIGLMYLTQKIAILMLDQEKTGQIINVASLAGKVSTPNYTAYGATKGAVISFSNALRMELKPFDIHVTTVNFGPVDTPFFHNIERSRRESAENNPLTMSGSKAGEIVAKTIGTKKREVNRPILLAIGAKLYDFIPGVGDYLLVKYFEN
jgi:hypothetical protein